MTRFLNLLSGVSSRIYQLTVAVCDRASHGGRAGADGASTRKTWSAAEFIDAENDDGRPGEWHLGFDPLGNGFMVTTKTAHVWANRFSADTGWGTPEIIDSTAHPAEDTLYGDIMYPAQVYVVANGNASAVWRQTFHNSSFYTTWINHYTKETGWGKATKFDNTPSDDHAPIIVGDERGTLYAVWTHNDYDRERHELWAQILGAEIFFAGADRGPATRIAENIGDARMATIKVDAAGNAYAMWAQGMDYKKRREGFSGKDSFDIWISRYATATGWDKATLIMREAESEQYPELAVDARGHAFAVWKQNETTRNRGTIWAKRYLADAGWGQSVQLSTATPDGEVGQPTVAIDAQGDALVLWRQGDKHLLYARCAADTGWSEAKPVSARVRSPQKPHIVFDRANQALTVWSQYAIGGVQIAMASCYTRDNGWSEPVALGKNNNDDKSEVELAVDAHGNAIAVWLQQRLAKGIWVNRYRAGQGWGRPKLIKRDFTGSATRPCIAFDARDTAHVTWTQSPSAQASYRVWTSRYEPTEWSGKTNTRNATRTVRAPVRALDLDDGQTPLHAAAEQGNRERVTDLLAAGADVNARDNHGRTALHLASTQGARDVVEALAARGAYLNALDDTRCTPLHRAIESGSIDLVELLIAHGADVKLCAPGGYTFLNVAANGNRLDIVRVLLGRGAIIDANNDNTLLHTAAARGDGEMVELFLTLGASVNARDSIDVTPLHKAAGDGNVAATKALLAHGADVHAKRSGNYTPLHDANGNDVVQMLIANGADANARHDSGGTPLHVAAYLHRKEVIDALIAGGADINAVDDNGKTPLDVADTMFIKISFESKDIAREMIALLEARGARRNLQEIECGP